MAEAIGHVLPNTIAATDGADAALPANGLLGLSLQRLVAEGEARFGERLRQIEGRIVRDGESLPRFQGLQRRFGINRGELRKSGLLGDDDPTERTEPSTVQECWPVEAWCQGLQASQRLWIIGCLDVTLLRLRPTRRGDA